MTFLERFTAPITREINKALDDALIRFEIKYDGLIERFHELIGANKAIEACQAHIIAQQDGTHERVMFSSGGMIRFIGCTCGEQFFADDSDPNMGYHVKNFVRSWLIKRQLRDEKK